MIFDNGYFSDFGTFSVTDWFGRVPKEMLGKNFGQPAAAFEGIPHDEVYFTHGPIPPAEIPTPIQGALSTPPSTHRSRLLA